MGYKNDIDFGHNWNKKLYNTYFPTYRILNEKYTVGNFYSVFLTKGKDRQLIKMVEIKEIIPMPLERVTNTVAMLDTGYELPEFIQVVQNMYGKDKQGNDQDIYKLNFGWIILKTIPSAFND
jgi:hypothetical protein